MYYRVFRNSVEPAFCVTFEADITKFHKKVKEGELSFTLAMVYAVCKYANEIEALRYRFVDGKIVLFDRIDTAFTYLNKETELFKVVNMPMVDNLKEYCSLALKTAVEQRDVYRWRWKVPQFRQCAILEMLSFTSFSWVQTS